MIPIVTNHSKLMRHCILWKNPQGSFINCLEMWPHFTQPYTQWILWEFIESTLKEPGGYVAEHILSNLWKNPQGSFTKHPVGKFWSNLWKNSVGSFTKCLMGIYWSDLWKNPQVSFKNCLMGTLMGFLWSHSQLTQQSHWDQSGGLFFWKNSQFAHWVKCGLII